MFVVLQSDWPVCSMPVKTPIMATTQWSDKEGPDVVLYKVSYIHSEGSDATSEAYIHSLFCCQP